MISVLLVDDQPAVRRGLQMRLALEPDLAIVGEAGDGEAALALAGTLRPDIVLMDLEMPRMDGLAATVVLRAVAPDTEILILSLHDDELRRSRARQAGAVEFVAKAAGEAALIATIRQVVARRESLVADQLGETRRRPGGVEEKKETHMHEDLVTPKRLYRSRDDRMIAGVCGGLGEYFSVDPVVIRLGFLLLALTTGVGFVAYLIMAVVVPLRPTSETTVSLPSASPFEPAEPIRPAPIRTEPIRTEPVRTESIQTESIQPESIQAEPIRAESIRTDSDQAEPDQAEPSAPQSTTTRQPESADDRR